VFSAVTR